MKAFPRQITFNNGISQGTWIDDGMELRDYFASKVISDFTKNHGYATASKFAYQLADEMMKAREEKK